MIVMKGSMFFTCILVGMLLTACGGVEMLPPPQASAVPSAALSASRLPATLVPTQVNPVMSLTPPAKTAVPTVKPTAMAVTATKPISNGSGLVLTSGSLTVRIDAPVDGATLKDSPVEVKGQAPVGTVISINEMVLVVSAGGNFSAKINLEQGPNLIEFLASDASDNQVFYTLAIYLEP